MNTSLTLPNCRFLQHAYNSPTIYHYLFSANIQSRLPKHKKNKAKKQEKLKKKEKNNCKRMDHKS